MKHPTQVNCFGHRHTQGAKDADRLRPKGTQRVAPADAWGTDIHRCRCGKQGLIHSCHCNHTWQTYIPPSGEGRRVRKERAGWQAEEIGKSERRSVTGRIGTAISSHRANGQTSNGSFVTRELAEPSQEEMANEHGLVHVCIFQPANAWEQIDWSQCERQASRLQARIVKATQEKRWGNPIVY